MDETDTDGVRYCDSCNQNVHWVNNVAEHNFHAKEGHCIAFDTLFYAIAGMPGGVLKEYSLVLDDEGLTAVQLASIREELFQNQSYSIVKSIYRKGNAVIEGVSGSEALKRKMYFDSIGLKVSVVETD